MINSSPQNGTLEVKIGWTTDGGSVKNITDGFTENEVFNFEALRESNLIGDKVDAGKDILDWVDLLSFSSDFDPGKIIPLVSNKRLFKWGLEAGVQHLFHQYPKISLNSTY